MEKYIIREKVVVLNEATEGSGVKVFKAWDERLDKYVDNSKIILIINFAELNLCKAMSTRNCSFACHSQVYIVSMIKNS